MAGVGESVRQRRKLWSAILFAMGYRRGCARRVSLLTTPSLHLETHHALNPAVPSKPPCPKVSVHDNPLPAAMAVVAVGLGGDKTCIAEGFVGGG